jgi:RND family efflux transporter MFP subunit
MRSWRWLVLGCAWAFASAAAEISISSDQVRLLELETAPVEVAAGVRIGGLPAQIEIAAQAQRAVVAPFAGQVLALHAEIGDELAKGAPLADLASSEHAAAAARLSQAQAQEQRSAAQARRDQQLFDEGVIARTRLEASSADLHAARAALQAERAAQVDIETLGPGRYRLLAPMAGVVVARGLAAQAPVAAWSSAFLIADPQQLVAVIQLPLARAASVGVGDRVQIGDAHGRVHRIGAIVEPQSQSLSLRAVLDEIGTLRSGQRTSAELIVAAPPDSWSLPRAALWFEGSAAQLFLELEPGRYRSVSVEVLEQDAANAVVRAELAAGARVVTRGVAALKALRETP